MALEKVVRYFEQFDLAHRVIELEQSSATVEQAAMAIGCAPEVIAKTMSFLLKEQPILIVTAGDVKIDNKKFKEHFHEKAKMIPYDQVEAYIGHAPGGVCPFGTNENVTVYLDLSLQRFDTVYPAGGSANSAVKLSLNELEAYSASAGWVDVCKSIVNE